MRLHDICFLSAALAALVGVCAGFAMGMSENFVGAPAHAHLNLLAWVSMAVMGLYYRGSVTTHRRLAAVQVGLGIVGFWTFPVSLGVRLVFDTDAIDPLIAAGAALAVLSFALFAAVIVLNMLDRLLEPLGAAHAFSG